MLDLKENNNSNKDGNSLKGFGLPRVVLTSLTTLTIDEDTKKSDYVGVVVYNTGSSLTEGIYSWGRLLQEQDKENHPGILSTFHIYRLSRGKITKSGSEVCISYLLKKYIINYM
ncbi:MAG: hypothetical protein LBR46_04255 [Prevotella sp.]|nr:hypothetical protein [Prevotella sp.]